MNESDSTGRFTELQRAASNASAHIGFTATMAITGGRSLGEVDDATLQAVVDADERCLSCKYQDILDRGQILTTQQRNHYMLWGCTCEPGSEAAALDFMKRVTE